MTAETTATTKTRRTRKPKAVNPAQGLLDALKFVSVCQKKAGTPMQQFCKIENHMVLATNETFVCGHPVPDDLQANPHTFKLIEALSKVENEVSITQLSQSLLSVKSGSFQPVIECFEAYQSQIDACENVAAIDDRIKEALSVVCPAASDNSTNTVYSNVLLQSGSAAATNGFIVSEAWHGHSLPTMLLPKEAAAAIAKSKIPLSGFGYDGGCATFWFENGAFVTVSLTKENFVNYSAIFEGQHEPKKIPSGFFKAVKQLSAFSKNGILDFYENLISCGKGQECCTFSVPGLKEGFSFSSSLLLYAKDFEKVLFDVEKNCARFFGKNKRCVIMAIDKSED